MIPDRIGNDIRIPLLVRYVYTQQGNDCLHGANGMLRRFSTGYHVPATRKRDLFYAKLERQREENQGTV